MNRCECFVSHRRRWPHRAITILVSLSSYSRARLTHRAGHIVVGLIGNTQPCLTLFSSVQFSSGRCVALRSLRFVHITRSSLPTPELFTSSYTSSKASSTKRLSHTYTYPHPPHRYPTIHVSEAVTTNLGRIGRILLLSTRPKTRQHCQAITEYVTAALYNTWTTTREWALRYT